MQNEGWVLPTPDMKRKYMNRFLEEKCEPKLMSPLALAFVGDSVYDLFVREYLLCEANRQVNKLHSEAVKKVKAQAQAQAYKKIADILTEEENEIFRRGKNAHTKHTPKNATSIDYHVATAMECLFGYLYLKGSIDRLRELFYIINSEEVPDEEKNTP